MSDSSTQVYSPIILPCGQKIKNRVAKAAMEENLAEANQYPGKALFNLYNYWANGGAGLLITGNVMIDHMAMTGPGGVVLEAKSDLKPFVEWAKKAKQNDACAWMQINHPGRQVFKKMKGKVLSPSDVALDMGKHSGMFPKPVPMTEEDISDVINRFADTAAQAELAGFDGVQVHAAHGYLLSQFLSPLTNKRDDQWGGNIENRARLLIEVIRAIRQRVSAKFAVAVKINSADFQRGGFDISDAEQVLALLQNEAVDLVEVSGGSYEAPAMQGKTRDGRTLQREAYFLEFAQRMAEQSEIPIMTTGGVRRLTTVQQVLSQGVDMVGIASAMASTPNLPYLWQTTPTAIGQVPEVSWQDKTLSGLATMAMVKRQLRRLSNNKAPLKEASPLMSLILDQIRAAKLTKRYRKQFVD